MSMSREDLALARPHQFDQLMDAELRKGETIISLAQKWDVSAHFLEQRRKLHKLAPDEWYKVDTCQMTLEQAYQLVEYR